MTELNIGAFSGSKSYTGSLGTTNIDNLYKFNISSPGSFQFSLNGLSGNADIFLLNQAGAIIKSSSNSDKTAETISAEDLSAGEYTIRVLQITGDIKYTLNLAQVNTPKKADTDIVTGTKVETTSAANPTILSVVSISEKREGTKDLITGTPAEQKTEIPAEKVGTTDKPVTTTSETKTTDKPVVITSEIKTTEKPVTTTSETKTTDKLVTTTSETTTEKPVTTTSQTTTEKPIATTSETTTEKPVTTTSETTTDKPVTTTSETKTTEKPVTTTSETTTEKPVTTTSEIKTTDKPVTTTSEIKTTDKPVTTTSEIKSTDKPVTTTSETTTEKPVTTTSEIKTTEKPVTTTSETTTDKPVTTTSEIKATEKPATTTSEIKATEKPVTTTSETKTTDKPVATTSETITDKPVTITSETTTTDKPVTTLPVTAIAETTAVTKDIITGEIIATELPKTVTASTADKPVIASLDDAKSVDKPNTATSNLEETKKENLTTGVATTETKKEPEPTTDKKLISPFTSGVFTTDQTGRISIDYTFDGGLFQGELAVFSLDGLEKFEPGSEAFIKEVAARSLSSSVKGHIVINDATEGARFSGVLGESNANQGVYLGVKSFAVTAGGKYGVMLVPNGSVKSVFDNPTVGGAQRPLFSMAMANPVEGFNFGQIADVTGEGNTFVMEDMRLDAGSDKDYNDIIFQVRGATGKAALLDTVINPDKDWRKTDLGKAVIAYAKPYINPEPKPKVDAEVSNLLDDLEKEILKPVTSDKETPKTPSPSPTTGKDANDSNKIVPISISPAKTEEKAKDSASNSGDLTKVETSDKVDTKPITAPTTAKDIATDSTEKSPVEKMPVPPVATEEKDKVTETPAATTLPAKSTTETEKVVLPVEGKTETEVAKPVTTEVAKAETPKVAVSGNSVEILETKLPVGKTPVSTAASEEKDKVVETSPPTILPAKSKAETEKVAHITPKVEAKSEVLPAISKTETEVAKPAITEVAKADIPKVGLPGNSVDSAVKENLLIPIGRNETTEVKPELPVGITAPAKEEIAQNNNNVNADWIARLESVKQRLSNLGGAGVVADNAIDRTLIARLETMTEKLREQTRSTTVSDNTGALISRLEDMVVKVAPPAIEPIQPVQFEFPVANQPLVGVIDTGFSGNNPDIDYSRIILGRDRVSNDANPLLATGEGSEHGTHILGIIGATQNNGVGIDGVNDKAPLWVGRAIGSGQWAESLVEFVNAAIESNQPNAVVNLSLDLTQINPDGSVTTRYEFTPEERSAIEYARQHNVLLVVAAGNDGGVMSVLGQASQEFDNIITVGAAERVNDEIALSKAYDRSDYSSYGRGLDIVADGGTVKNPVLSTTGDGVGAMAGTSVATAKVTGAVSQVWAANPSLSYRQVIQIIKDTATDLKTPNWDDETGAGLLNMVAAVAWAEATMPKVYQPAPWVTPDTWSGQGKVTPEERAAKGGNSLAAATVQASSSFSDSDRVDSNQPEKYYQFTVTEPGYVSWNLTSLNPVSGFPTPPQVTVTKADGKPGSHAFFKVKGASLQTSAVGEGQTSFQGGNFYDPGTYYLKVGNGAWSTFNDYNISTQFIADRVSSFTGNIQYRTQPYYSLDNSLQSAVFSGPAVSELSNLSGVVTYDNINFNNRIAKYGVEVNESGKIRINLNSPNGKMEVSVNKFIGSDDRPKSIASLEVSANSDGWLELDLNKGRYDIEVKTPSNVWLEPDWNSTQQKLVRPYTLNATFAPNAPQAGQGQVPSSAGAFDKTVVSNGVVNHYYKNGYLTVQPSGQASWYSYGTGNAIGVIEISAVPLPFEIPPDYAGNSPDKARDIGTLIGTQTFHDVIDRNDRFDYYKFNITSESKVDFALSGKMGNTGFYLFQDWYFNSDDSTHIDIISGTPPNGVVPEFSQTLKPGSYYVLVHKPKDYDGDEYDLTLSATPLGDPDGNYSIQTAQDLSYSPADFGDGVERRANHGSIGGNNLSDFYKFSLSSLKLVNFQLSQLSNAAKLELIQDLNGNGQVDWGEAITTGITGSTPRSPLSFDRILEAGNYYLRVSPGPGATSATKYQVDVALHSPENKVVAGYNSDYYLVQNGQRRIIPNLETLNALGINPQIVKIFPPEDLVRIPLGKALPSRKDGDVFQDLSGRIYLMQSGKRRLVPDWDTLRAIGINVTVMPTFPESDLKDIEFGDPYAPPIPQWQKDIDNTYQYARNLLGNPTGDYGRTISSLNGAQGYGRNYDNGTVYWSDRSGAIALWHGFANTYNENGSFSGWLGFPTKANENWKDGQRIDFEGGYIYWTAQDGAKAYPPNESPSLDKTVGYDGTNTHQTYVNTFNNNGGLSALGSATGNVHPVGTRNGYLQEFSGGSEGSGAIMKSGANDNSYWVGGAFWFAYQDAVKNQRDLGYPTSDRFVDENGLPAQNFQNGKVVEQDGKLYVYLVKETSSNPDPTLQVNNPPGFTPVVFTLSVGVDTNYGIRLRTDTNLNAPGEGVTHDSQIEFDGWKYGEAVQDRTKANGQMDALWYRVKGTNYWIPSAFINGYPPNYQPPVSSGGNTGNTGNTGGSNTGGNSGTLLLQPVDASYFLARPQFYTTGNPFFPYNAPVSVGGTGGLLANCTWYASGRAKEMGGNPEALSSMLGNAGTWGNNLSNSSQIVYQPQVGDIAEWTKDGHVAVVEQVNSDGSIVISESNYAGILHHIRTIYPGQVGTQATGWPDRFIRAPKKSTLNSTASTKPQIISSSIIFGAEKLTIPTNFLSYPWADQSTLIQGSMPAGTTFTLLEKVTTNDSNSATQNWYKVSLTDGREGYFLGENVSTGGLTYDDYFNPDIYDNDPEPGPSINRSDNAITWYDNSVFKVDSQGDHLATKKPYDNDREFRTRPSLDVSTIKLYESSIRSSIFGGSPLKDYDPSFVSEFYDHFFEGSGKNKSLDLNRLNQGEINYLNTLFSENYKEQLSQSIDSALRSQLQQNSVSLDNVKNAIASKSSDLLKALSLEKGSLFPIINGVQKQTLTLKLSTIEYSYKDKIVNWWVSYTWSIFDTFGFSQKDADKDGSITDIAIGLFVSTPAHELQVTGSAKPYTVSLDVKGLIQGSVQI